jgi:hypothetical protein
LNGSAERWILSASLALASGVSTTLPSTPAVRRPALRSVTRRTHKSAFVRERSINFCSVADLLQVPHLRRREDPLPQPPYVVPQPRRQSTWRQSRGASSGPFTAPTVVVAASNLSSGSGLRSSSSPQAHLTASAPFRAGPPVSYPAGYPRRPPGGGGHRPVFPSAPRTSMSPVRLDSTDVSSTLRAAATETIDVVRQAASARSRYSAGLGPVSVRSRIAGSRARRARTPRREWCPRRPRRRSP